MEKINIGILGTSEIAYRRFIPALKKSKKFKYAGVASRNIEKTERFYLEYGGERYGSYEDIINDNSIDAVYIPLPPALHFDWAKKALENGKHVFLEKPSTTNLKDVENLIRIADEKSLALKENYMFIHHNQTKYILNAVKENLIGDSRLVRISFTFPKRNNDDFRYNKELGGGSLLDCGGYTINMATKILGEKVDVKYAKLNYLDEYEVDMFGSATLENKDGLVAQLSFGMDNAYRCELEIIGSKGSIKSERIFTAPSDFSPEIVVETDGKKDIIKLESYDQFLGSLEDFGNCINNKEKRKETYKKLILQSELVEKIRSYN